MEAKADGYRALVASAGGDARSAATLLITEKLEELVAVQVAAFKAIKIDKVIVWDAGAATRKRWLCHGEIFRRRVSSRAWRRCTKSPAWPDLICPSYLGEANVLPSCTAPNCCRRRSNGDIPRLLAKGDAARSGASICRFARM